MYAIKIVQYLILHQPRAPVHLCLVYLAFGEHFFVWQLQWLNTRIRVSCGQLFGLKPSKNKFCGKKCNLLVADWIYSFVILCIMYIVQRTYCIAFFICELKCRETFYSGYNIIVICDHRLFYGKNNTNKISNL